jgi:hypothetical protein
MQKARRDRGADDVPERLANARIIEAAIDMPALYAPLSMILHQQGYYQPYFISAEAIDKWNPNLKDGEMQAAARKRRQRFRTNMQLTCAVSSFEYRHRGKHSVTLVLWRLPAQSDRTSICQLRAEAEVIKGLPCYLSNEQLRSLHSKYRHVLGCNVAPGTLRAIVNEATHNQAASRNPELDKRFLQYCMSQGNLNLWPDLRAIANGATTKYDVFYKIAGDAIEDISGATADRHGTHRVLTTSSAHLVSISALHRHTMEKMDSSDEEPVREAPRPSEQLLRMAFCPQHCQERWQDTSLLDSF